MWNLIEIASNALYVMAYMSAVLWIIAVIIVIHHDRKGRNPKSPKVKLQQVCISCHTEAINIIKDTNLVYFKSNVQGKYELVDTQYAIMKIRISEYGADVYVDTRTETYYVVCQ